MATDHIRAVFFDAGGTLIYLDRAFILSALADRGLNRTEAQFVAADAAARKRVGGMLRGNQPSDDASRWHVYAATMLHELECTGADAEFIRDLVTRRHIEGRLWSHTLAGTAAVLENVRARGITVGIVSNSDGRIAAFLEHAGLLAHFDFIVDSGIVGFEKPDPAIFRIACERAGVKPGEAVHIGDIYEIDVLGARAHGIRAVLLDPHDTHADVDCDRIASLEELPAWLDRQSCS